MDEIATEWDVQFGFNSLAIGLFRASIGINLASSKFQSAVESAVSPSISCEYKLVLFSISASCSTRNCLFHSLSVCNDARTTKRANRWSQCRKSERCISMSIENILAAFDLFRMRRLKLIWCRAKHKNGMYKCQVHRLNYLIAVQCRILTNGFSLSRLHLLVQNLRVYF